MPPLEDDRLPSATVRQSGPPNHILIRTFRTIIRPVALMQIGDADEFIDYGDDDEFGMLNVVGGGAIGAVPGMTVGVVLGVVQYGGGVQIIYGALLGTLAGGALCGAIIMGVMTASEVSGLKWGIVAVLFAPLIVVFGAFVGVFGSTLAFLFVFLPIGIHAFLWRIGVDSADGRPYNSQEKGLSLTPSDVLLLNKRPKKNKKKDGVARVQVGDLTPGEVPKLLATALLANEEAGLLRLETGDDHVMEIAENSVSEWPAGSHEFVLTRINSTGDWPVGSLEFEFFRRVTRNGITASDIIFNWIGETTNMPYRVSADRIMKGMVSRGLLVQDRKKVLHLFTLTSTYYVLPERVVELATRSSESMQHVDVFDRLLNDITDGFTERTEERPDD